MRGRAGKSLPSLGAAARGIYLMGAAVVLVACGGNSASSTYTIGGKISGLSTGSVVLVNNGISTVTVSAGATTWAFPTAFAAGSSYTVSVLTQPTGELCAVSNGGSAVKLTADVDDVDVVCGDNGLWTWEGGSNTVNATGVYGTQGATSASSAPGARYAASSWTDSSGNFWLFGGDGYDSTGTAGYLNDLWQYSPSSGVWTWISGASAANAAAAYGTQGSASSTTMPGARYAASSWIDSSGNLWVFGGYGYDSAGDVGSLNDLWKYTPGTREWTWVSGGDVGDTPGVYGGAPGNTSPGDVPGTRYAASSWIDSTGNLWLFGGYGYDSTGALGRLNDLWRYSPGSGVWTWVSGADTRNTSGTYGTQGSAATGVVPGARQAASSWTDSSGNLWLFGGYGYDSSGAVGDLNDLWQYSTSTQLWTWVSGADVANATAVYGTLGTALAGVVPGARQAASSWIDSSGNLWLFGGAGYGSGQAGSLSDIWEYRPDSGLWAWEGGGSTSGVYGTQGSAAATTAPGARYAAGSWTDSSGNLWLFGGAGYSASSEGYLNDLWQFVRP